MPSLLQSWRLSWNTLVLIAVTLTCLLCEVSLVKVWNIRCSFGLANTLLAICLFNLRKEVGCFSRVVIKICLVGHDRMVPNFTR